MEVVVGSEWVMNGLPACMYIKTCGEDASSEVLRTSDPVGGDYCMFVAVDWKREAVE